MKKKLMLPKKLPARCRIEWVLKIIKKTSIYI